ncbi:hypothetical protein ACFFU9_07410 [Mariniflexile ostreae]|uniref:STAS/SEC14 domain-containing protein n=1 Tax=Mariniflexile ostreae TaxID=1520892 RepID=A0ABV5FAW2_9FLAO
MAMKFENSKYSKILNYYKLEKPFGNFYLCDNFLISELHEGIHFDWEMIASSMDEVIEYYGKNKSIGYISNRVNSYSMNPHNWNKVYDIYNILHASAVVFYNDLMYMNATLEKQLSDKSIKRCKTLDEAIDWIMNLNEFK